MIPLTRDTDDRGTTRAGTQPIALAGAALLIILAGAASIALWRVYTGSSPEADRLAAARQLQARAAQASEQLVEKTKGLEATQQESIDQLQMLQEQLQTVRRLLAAQQADTRRLSGQVSTLTEAVDGLRQSHASAQAAEQPSAAPTRNRSVRNRAHASRAGQRHRRGKSSS
jgi:peptidoglycan hydrolase CwlO-like protein